MLADPATANRWREAIGLVDAAADAGHAEAIERRALFECMGIGRQPDWNRALDSLANAAELGSLTAQGQLLVLADESISAEAPTTSWGAVRKRVPIADRLRANHGRTLSANPLIRATADFISPSECQWLIKIAAPRLERAIIYSKETGEAAIHPGRTNQFALFPLVDLDCVVELVRARISSAIGAPLPCLEVSQVLHYQVGEEFSDHCDYLDPFTMADEIRVRGQRAATVLIYLNDNFEGGETSFPDLGIEHRGKAGDALMFSSVDPSGHPDARTRHAGKSPSKGEKWLFSQWIRDRLPT